MMFGKVLLDFRARHGLTQKQLGVFLGIAKNSVCRYENGKVTPSKANRLRFENKLKEYEGDKK